MDVARVETHFPKAFVLFSFVPYFVLKAAGSAVRSAEHVRAAFTFSARSPRDSARRLQETHLPKAFAPVPYLAWNAALSDWRAAAHACAAFSRFSASSRVHCLTQRPWRSTCPRSCRRSP